MRPGAKMVAVAAVVVIVAGVALYSTGSTSRDVSRTDGAARLMTGSAGAPKASSELVLSIAPGAKRTSTVVQPKVPLTPLMQAFAKRRDYKTLYDRAKSAPDKSGEDYYLMAEVLERCAKVTDRKSGTTHFKMGAPGSRERFVASLPPGAPNRDKRIAAFDAFNVDACAGLEGLETTEAELRSLLEKGAAAGDAKSQALLLAHELRDQRRDAKGEIDWKKPISITDAQIETFKRVLSSGDPRALVDVMDVLQMDANFHLRAPDQSAIESSSLYYAATLAACELGYPCGPDAFPVLTACAMVGQCDAADYRDYLLYYQMAPGSSQQVIQYQTQLLRLVREGDWSFFTVVRGPSPMFAAFPRP